MIKTITNFINSEYKEYANYVLSSRAIPSLCDGFKPSQRKIMFTAIKSASTKQIKTAALSGHVISGANFHHGNSSLDGAISLMAADWKNNISLLQGEGNFGSRLVNEPAAARYTFVKLHKNFDKYFPDRDLIEYYRSDDPEDPEPKFYLPLVPWVLATGVKGIAVGHATEIQAYSIKDLKRVCLKYLTGKDISKEKLLPHFENFDGTVFSKDGAVYAQGVIEMTSALAFIVTELPPGIERETYINILDNLEENGKIQSYVDNCTDGKFRFNIKLKRGTKKTKDQLIKMLRLTSKLNENLTTIDENGKLAIFDTKSDLIEHFCDWRLEQYQVRFAHYIHRDKTELKKVTERMQYIKDVNSDKIVFKNKTKKELVAFVKNLYKLSYVDHLITMPMYALTKDNLETLKSAAKKLSTNIKTWQNLDHLEAYMHEIKSL